MRCSRLVLGLKPALKLTDYRLDFPHQTIEGSIIGLWANSQYDIRLYPSRKQIDPSNLPQMAFYAIAQDSSVLVPRNNEADPATNMGLL